MGEAARALLALGADPCLSECCIFSKGLPGRAGTRKIVQLNFRPLMPVGRGGKAVSGVGLQCQCLCGHTMKRCSARQPLFKG
ncbi:hypothetical protein Nmel_014404 [Mimus melanotis]